MSIVALLEYHVRADQVAEFGTAMAALTTETRAADGCLGATLHQDQDERTVFVLITRWVDRATRERYVQRRRDQGDANFIPALTTHASRRYLEDVAT